MSKMVGVIVCTGIDRQKSGSVTRGSLSLFGRLIAERVYQNLRRSVIEKPYVYTNTNGKTMKEKFVDKARFIYSTSYLLSKENVMFRDLSILFETYDSIMIIDGKYPFFDEHIINSFVEFHDSEQNEISFISCEYRDMNVSPNIVILSKKAFFQVFNEKNTLPKILNNKVILQYAGELKVGYFQTTSAYELMPINNEKVIEFIESTFLHHL